MFNLILPIIGTLVDRLIPDINKAGETKAELAKLAIEAEANYQKLEAERNQAQAEINKIEAASSNVFVSGWRPFIGWICGVAFLYHFVLQPFVTFILFACGYNFILPIFDPEALYTVLLGMLGLGGMRSFEKFKGVTK
jgi:hypothetical protein